MMKVHIYEAKDGFRWRLRARNGRIVAESGEAYSTRAACGQGWKRVRQEAYRTEVIQDKE